MQRKKLALRQALALASAPALVAALTGWPAAARAEAPKLEIPFERYQLDNGLTVILSEDHTVPTVTVNVMVHVGSRFEAPKRTGFAHLFEHLMFMGTDRVPTGKYDEWMEAEGGSNNAWTSEDRTDFFDVGPAHSLPLLLWLEADRLGALGATMTQEKLEVQRKVVRKERQQRTENQPYMKGIELRLPELLYPEGHPYHHPVIGSHEDLEAATLDDVKGFFAQNYVPSNMSLVVAGDFDAKATKVTIQKLFDTLPKAPAPAEPPRPPVPKLTHAVRETLEDDVQLAKIVMAWHSPARFQPGDAELDLLSNVLDHGKASRLYKALVFDKELAQSVSATQESRDLSGQFTLEIVARPKVDLAEIERVVDAELAKLAKEPVTQAELDRARNDYETGFVRQLESVENRASQLNAYQTYVGDPGFIQKDLERYRSVTRDTLFATAKSVLDPEARVVLRIVPKGTSAESSKTDASKPARAAGEAKPPAKPETKPATKPSDKAPAPKPQGDKKSPQRPETKKGGAK
jgi:predicted Zn-dependent peptidase